MKKLMIITLAFILQCNFTIFASFEGRPPLHPKTTLRQNSILLENGRILKKAQTVVTFEVIQKIESRPLGMMRSKTIAKNLNDFDSEVIQYMNSKTDSATSAEPLVIDIHMNKYYNSLLDDEKSPSSVTANILSPENI